MFLWDTNNDVAATVVAERVLPVRPPRSALCRVPTPPGTSPVFVLAVELVPAVALPFFSALLSIQAETDAEALGSPVALAGGASPRKRFPPTLLGDVTESLPLPELLFVRGVRESENGVEVDEVSTALALAVLVEPTLPDRCLFGPVGRFTLKWQFTLRFRQAWHGINPSHFGLRIFACSTRANAQ